MPILSPLLAALIFRILIDLLMKMSMMKKQLLLLAMLVFAGCSGQLTEHKLDEPTEIDGIPYAREALIHADGRLEGCLRRAELEAIAKFGLPFLPR